MLFDINFIFSIRLPLSFNLFNLASCYTCRLINCIIITLLKFDHFFLDDGGGMDPEAMRRCMSFGFSDKSSKSAIGQCMEICNHFVILHFKLLPYCIYLFTCSLPDGNGFKTSTMRLGADVIVFSRHVNNRFGSRFDIVYDLYVRIY